MQPRTQQRRNAERRSILPDTTKKMVLKDRRLDSLANRIWQARVHAARMRELYPRIGR